MNAINLTISLPDRTAREAEAQGLLSPRAVARLVREEMRRRAAERLRKGAEQAVARGSKPMSLTAIQREVESVRSDRNSRSVG